MNEPSFKFAQAIGYPALMGRAAEAVQGLSDGFIAAGFSNGLLLGGLVGGGFLVAGTWQWRSGWHACELSMLAGFGLLTFEVA